MPSKQEIFNRVWQYFVVEKNGRAGDPGMNGCYYRAANGNKCAVGILIPDNVYVPDLEIAVMELLSKFPHMSKFIGNDVDFLQVLQSCHDDADEYAFNEDMEVNLRNLASNFSLSIPQQSPVGV